MRLLLIAVFAFFWALLVACLAPVSVWAEQPGSDDILMDPEPKELLFDNNMFLELEPSLPEQELRREVLANIEYLSRQLQNHSLNGREGRVLASLAAGMAVSLMDGVATSLIARYFSKVIRQSHWLGMGMTVGAYSGLAMTMAYSLMHALGWIQPLKAATHLRFVLESALAGQAAGLLAGLLSASSWGWLRAYGAGPAALLTFGQRVNGFSRFPQAEQDIYSSSVHYILMKVAAGLGYGLLRSYWRSSSLEQQRQTLENSLAKEKQALIRLDEEKNGVRFIFSP